MQNIQRYLASNILKISLLLSLSLLTACNKPPSVELGKDKVYYERSKIMISAQVSDENEDDTHTFAWQQTAGGSVDGIENDDTSRVIIHLPSIANDESYTFSVTVTDEGGKQASDDITITAKAYKTYSQLSFKDPTLQQCTKTELLHLAWRDMGEATELRCTNPALRDISDLAGQLPKLEQLNLAGANITDFTSLKRLARLKELNLNNTALNDLSPLSKLKNLKQLSIKDTRISSLGPLSGLGKLEYLNASNTHLKQSNLKALAKLSNLKELHLHHSTINDASALAGLVNLEKALLNNNQLGNISGLAGLSKLSQLQLEDNKHIYCRDLKSLQNKLGSAVIMPKSCLR